jgi:hydroxymethylglutaryl-CoA lyase
MTKNRSIQLIECPRDAMQGWQEYIPAEKKAAYINSLLQVGFDTIDFGSFVSPKAIPQMRDTKEVLSKIEMDNTPSRLLAIVANTRGAEEAVVYDEISYLGFPFSISPTFQLRNTNSTIEVSLQRVEEIQTLCLKNRKQLVIYLSMGFGNPYGDVYNDEVLLQWADAMAERGISIISLADTIGIAQPEQIHFALNTLIPKYEDILFGVHLHSTPTNWKDKLEAALEAGCMRIDGALKGIGGCPMAQDDLVGNMDTEKIIQYLKLNGGPPSINQTALDNSLQMATQLFHS